MPKLQIRIYWFSSIERYQISPHQLTPGCKFTLNSEETWRDFDEITEYKLIGSTTQLSNGRVKVQLTYEQAQNPHIDTDLRQLWGASTLIFDRDRKRLKATWDSSSPDDDSDGPAGRAEIVDLKLDLLREAEEILRLKRKQGKLRNRLVEELGFRCELTGKTSNALLEAAHIVPVSKSSNDEPENGLLLKLELHRLYDKGYFAFEVDGAVSPTAKATQLNRRERAMLSGLRLSSASLSRVKNALDRSRLNA